MVFQRPANNACSKSHSTLRSTHPCPHHTLNNMNNKQEKDGPSILPSTYSPYDFFTTGVVVLYLASDWEINITRAKHVIYINSKAWHNSTEVALSKYKYNFERYTTKHWTRLFQEIQQLATLSNINTKLCMCFTHRLHNECSATYLIYDTYHLNAIFTLPCKKIVRSEATILH
jgi:hypothetical protein